MSLIEIVLYFIYVSERVKIAFRFAIRYNFSVSASKRYKRMMIEKRIGKYPFGECNSFTKKTDF